MDTPFWPYCHPHLDDNTVGMTQLMVPIETETIRCMNCKPNEMKILSVSTILHQVPDTMMPQRKTLVEEASQPLHQSPL
jgi:hypothetical protein